MLRTLNVLIAGHAQAGKSSLISSIVGKFPDILDFEIAHGTTVSLKVIQFELKKASLLLNLLDTAGHADFKASPALGLEFADLLVLVVSGYEGFQAGTYWLFEKAKEKNIPIIIAATKMDMPTANIKKIQEDIEKLGDPRIPIILTSSKKSIGIEDLIEKISIFVKNRNKKEKDLSFIVLGFDFKKGLGNIINVGILSGEVEINKFITPDIKIKAIYNNINNKPIKNAYEGEIVQLLLNIDPKFELGTKYFNGRFYSPRFDSLLSEVLPRKEFFIEIDDPNKFKLSIQILEDLKKIMAFDYYTEKSIINLLVVGDLQFDLIKERLEDLFEFKIIGSRIKGIITINKISTASYKTASVRIVPRCKKKLTTTREDPQQNKTYDILAASTAYEAFHLDGLHVDIFSGKSEDHIAQAIAKAIEKVKIIKIVPFQDIIVKVENYHDIYPLIEKYNIEVLYQSMTDTFFLQVKNDDFEDFFNSLMKISKGKAEINLFKFDQSDKILSVDPGTRHFGFSLIEKGELPSLWYVNLKKDIEDQRTQKIAKSHLSRELDIFLGEGKELVNKIFIGNGSGSDFVIEFLSEYFNIPSETESSSNHTEKEIEDHKALQIKSPDIFLVDEFKTSKEALFHLQQGKLVNEVQSKGFVDHAIAALLIAKRGIKGEIIKIEKKPLKQLYDYIVEHFAGSYSFSSIHNLKGLEDIKQGIFLRIKDPSKLDGHFNEGDIINFRGWGDPGYKTFQAQTLSGNRIFVKFQGNVKVKSEFFNILTPVKERN